MNRILGLAISAAFALALPASGQLMAAHTGISAAPTLAAADLPTITGVTVRQMGALNGTVDISYTVTGDIAAEAERRASMASLKVTATDMNTGKTYTATQLAGDASLAPGAHSLTWDMDADGLSLQSGKVAFTVFYETKPAPYCVIDLSAGASATGYPVVYQDDSAADGFNTDEYKTAKLVLRRIEPGAIPTRDAVLTKPYYMGIFELTQRQYELITGSNPCASSSRGKGDACPVHFVSYDMIRGESKGAGWPESSEVDEDGFLGILRKKTGLQDLDLPTVAQWENACRAGTTTAYNYGDSADERYMWYSENADAVSHEVGVKLPNAWNLYDMHGNVWEWCLNWTGGTNEAGEDPAGAATGTRRALRGGSWNSNASWCRTISGSDCAPSSYGNGDVGFRLARTLQSVDEDGILCSGSVVVENEQSAANAIILTEGSTSGYTMTDGNTYVVQNSVSFSNSTAGGSGMSVADNATVVLYVPKGVTLTATGRRGGYHVGGGAGILVPETAALIITGQGTVNATGGDAGNGANGGNGGNASVLSSTPYAGVGGYGGGGGGGAGAGIGGCGGSTGKGQTMGVVYVLGGMKMATYGGESGYDGSSGKTGSPSVDHRESNYIYASGGGGGGGGGGGYAPTYSIGGGGAAGADGRKGGNGSITRVYNSTCSSGATGSTGGRAGQNGGVGTLYVSPTATVDVEREKLSATTHPAAQYTMTFDANGGQLSSSPKTLTATLGCELPDCIPAPTKRYYIFEGWATATGEAYYDASGAKLLSSYSVADDVVLLAQWRLDEAWAGYTIETPAPVPHSWLDRNCPASLEAHGGDYEEAAFAAAANGRPAWECYVLGLDPANADDDFRITGFTMENGVPRITYEPGGATLAPDGDAKIGPLNLPVKLKGKAELGDDWRDVPKGGDASFRFFTAEVEVR